MLVAAIGEVLAGRRAFDDALPADPATGQDPDTDLTPRELQVLRMVCDGASPADVADALVISPKTVSNHLTSVYAKLGVHSRTEAVATALRRGLVRPPR